MRNDPNKMEMQGRALNSYLRYFSPYKVQKHQALFMHFRLDLSIWKASTTCNIESKGVLCTSLWELISFKQVRALGCCRVHRSLSPKKQHILGVRFLPFLFPHLNHDKATQSRMSEMHQMKFSKIAHEKHFYSVFKRNCFDQSLNFSKSFLKRPKVSERESAHCIVERRSFFTALLYLGAALRSRPQFYYPF